MRKILNKKSPIRSISDLNEKDWDVLLGGRGGLRLSARTKRKGSSANLDLRERALVFGPTGFLMQLWDGWRQSKVGQQNKFADTLPIQLLEYGEPHNAPALVVPPIGPKETQNSRHKLITELFDRLGVSDDFWRGEVQDQISELTTGPKGRTVALGKHGRNKARKLPFWIKVLQAFGDDTVDYEKTVGSYTSGDIEEVWTKLSGHLRGISMSFPPGASGREQATAMQEYGALHDPSRSRSSDKVYTWSKQERQLSREPEDKPVGEPDEDADRRESEKAPTPKKRRGKTMMDKVSQVCRNCQTKASPPV